MRKIASSGVLLIVVLFGCKKSETAAPSPTATQATSTTATVAPAPAPAPQPTPAPVAAAPTAGAIASTDGEKPGMHIDVTELKRTSGGTVNLKFVIANNGGERVYLYSSYLGDHAVSKDHNRDVSGIHLLDPMNKKKYFVVTDADKSCVCSKEIADLEPGGKLNLWAKFPAPAPEVTKVTIEIPHFAPIDDVTISQ
jgi:hypothetical protein